MNSSPKVTQKLLGYCSFKDEVSSGRSVQYFLTVYDVDAFLHSVDALAGKVINGFGTIFRGDCH